MDTKKAISKAPHFKAFQEPIVTGFMDEGFGKSEILGNPAKGFTLTPHMANGL